MEDREVTPDALVERVAKALSDCRLGYVCDCGQSGSSEHEPRCNSFVLARAALREMHLQPDRAFEEWVVVAQRARRRVDELEAQLTSVSGWAGEKQVLVARVAALEAGVREACTEIEIHGAQDGAALRRLARLRALVG